MLKRSEHVLIPHLQMAQFDTLMGLEDWCTFLPPMPQNLPITDDPFGASTANGMH